ncbi:MAG TPA: hypothetical protein VHZ51_11085, partial [Ktedonobacteraceae bacterium]|nr:hypothetical protein [Ktedonobacteraceae bacterium]
VVAAWVQSLMPERRDEYLVRLIHNDPGLSRLLVRELRELNQDKANAVVPTGERVTYTTLLAESKAGKVRAVYDDKLYARFARGVRAILQRTTGPYSTPIVIPSPTKYC